MTVLALFWASATALLLPHGTRAGYRHILRSRPMLDEAIQVRTATGTATSAVLGPVRCGCCSWSLEDVSELSLPRLTLVTDGSPVTDEAIECALKQTDGVLRLARPFTIYWDLRRLAVPSRRQLRKGIGWIDARLDALDKGV